MRIGGMARLFEPRRRVHRILFLNVLDVIMLVLLGIAFLLVDLAFRDLLAEQDVRNIRWLMVVSWLVVFILQVGTGYVKEKMRE